MLPLRFSRFIAVVFFFLAVFSAVKSRWIHNYWKDIIVYDGKGYYSYLPAVFIYHDLQWKFMDYYEKKYYKPERYYDYTNYVEDGRKVNKYFCGVAVMQAPFFMVAWASSYLFGYAPDGYSLPFQLCVSIAAVFYFALGIYFLSRLLVRMRFRRIIVAALLVFIAFGTNLFYYAATEPCMSHAYSFCAVAGFLLYLRLAIDEGKTKYFAWCAFWFGMVCIIRPTNAVVILAVPAFAGSLENLKNLFRDFFSVRVRMLITLGVLCSVLGLQIVLIYLQTGKPLIWTYGHEGFDFLQPELFNVLFSYRKGFFVYTPMAFVALLGLYFLARENKFSAVTLFLLLFIAAYIISCWWLWWYGGSFGMRPFIEYYPFFAILLGYLLTRPRQLYFKITMWALCLASLYYTRVQTWQYKAGLIHYAGINEEKFWNIFLLSSFPLSNENPSHDADSAAKPDTVTIVKHLRFFNNFDTSKTWGGEQTYTTKRASSGQHSVKLDGKTNYSPGFLKKFSEIGKADKLVLRVTAMIYPEELSGDAVLVVCYKQDGQQYYWKGYPLKERCQKTRDWNTFIMEEKLPPPKTSEDNIHIYFYNSTRPAIYIDDFKIEFFELK